MTKRRLSTDSIEIRLNPFSRRVKVDTTIVAGMDGGHIDDSVECSFVLALRVRLPDGTVRVLSHPERVG